MDAGKLAGRREEAAEEGEPEVDDWRTRELNGGEERTQQNETKSHTAAAGVMTGSYSHICSFWEK